MKLFRCHHCAQVLYFENWRCERCGHHLGYAPWLKDLLVIDGDDRRADGARSCQNSQLQACNWLIPAGEAGDLCRACRHNRMIPDLSQTANLARWREFEAAKRRLFYSLIGLELPIPTAADHTLGLVFDFLADPDGPNEAPVMTGHADGVITINILEADHAARESIRQSMGEPYRTVLGHFRHEIGHFYWQLLIDTEPRKEDFRAVFGDEREDYGEALQRHHNVGPPADWQSAFVSGYATAHPWEDFAETWAHYLHIVDTLEMADAFRISVDPRVSSDPSLEAEIDFNPYTVGSIEGLIERWLPLSFAVNSLNRSMGHADFYPFLLSQPAVAKLGFVHDLIHKQCHDSAPMRSAPS